MAQRKSTWGSYNQEDNCSREGEKSSPLPDEIQRFLKLCEYYSKLTSLEIVQQHETTRVPQNRSLMQEQSVTRKDFTNLSVIPSAPPSQIIAQECPPQIMKSFNATSANPSQWFNYPQVVNPYEHPDLPLRDSRMTVGQLRQIRQDNILKLWAIQTITNGQSNAVIDHVPPSTNESNPACSMKERHNKKDTQLCYFCMKKGELRNVSKHHDCMDKFGNINACELCGPTSVQEHTKSNCPLYKF